MALTEADMWNFKIVWSATIWPKWQVVIPKNIREEMWVETGDNLVCISKWGKWVIFIKADTVLEFIDYVKNELQQVKNKSENKKKLK